MNDLIDISLDELTQFLETQTEELDSAIGQAEQQQAKREEIHKRLEALIGAIPRIRSQVDALQKLGSPQEAKALELLEKTETAVAQLRHQLDTLDDPEPEVEEEPVTEQEPDPQEEHPAEVRNADPQIPLFERLFSEDPARGHTHFLQNPLYIASALYSRAQLLHRFRAEMEPVDLFIELCLIGGILRHYQELYPSMKDGSGTEEATMSGKVFGSLVGTSKMVTPNRFIEAASKTHNLDWEQYVEQKLQQRNENIELRKQEREKARRESEHEQEQLELQAQLTDILGSHPVDTKQLVEWLREHSDVGSYLDDTTKAALLFFEDEFQGNEFRGLRRVLKKYKEPTKATKTGTKRSAPAKKIVQPAPRALKGKSALIIGGLPRAMRQQSMEKHFKFSNLDWIEPDNVADYLKTRLPKGKYDVVFTLLGLCSHEATQAAKDLCKLHGVVYVPLANGYGNHIMAKTFKEAVAKQKATV